MSCAQGDGGFYVARTGERGRTGGGKSQPPPCGLTTHLRVAGNFESRGRATRGFSTATHPFPLPASLPPTPCHPPVPTASTSTSIVKGCSRVLRGPEERGSLSREEIVFPPRGRKFSCRSRRVSCVSEARRDARQSEVR